MRSIQHGEAGVVELFLGLKQYVIEHMKYARVAGPLEVAARALPPSVGRHSRNAATKTAVRASTTVCGRQGPGYSLKRIEIARSSALATFKPLSFHEIQALRDDLASAIQDETGKVDS